MDNLTQWLNYHAVATHRDTRGYANFISREDFLSRLINDSQLESLWQDAIATKQRQLDYKAMYGSGELYVSAGDKLVLSDFTKRLTAVDSKRMTLNYIAVRMMKYGKTINEAMSEIEKLYMARGLTRVYRIPS